LLAQSDLQPSELLKKLRNLQNGPVFYQLMALSFEAMLEEAYQAESILDKQLVVKLPPTDLGFKVCSELSSRMACCPTAVYTPAQALIAREAGAQYLAVYVNRATRLLGDGLALISEIAQVLKGGSTHLLAASLKSPEEAIAAHLAGAHDLTLPFDTLMAMSQHEASTAAVAQFQKDGVGLTL